jgi:hypothetical protein
VGAILAVSLAGYGTLGRKWKNYAIAEGVAEGVAEGTVVGVATGVPLLGVAVAVEEAVRDTVVALGGVSAYNGIYAPVVLEASLTSAEDGEIVWAESAYATEDSGTLNTLPKEERDKREVQLRLTSEKALRELIAELEQAAKKNSQRSSPSQTAFAATR